MTKDHGIYIVLIARLPEEVRDGLRVAADGVEETGQAQAQDGGDEKEQENQLLRQLGKEYYQL